MHTYTFAPHSCPRPFNPLRTHAPTHAHSPPPLPPSQCWDSDSAPLAPWRDSPRAAEPRPLRTPGPRVPRHLPFSPFSLPSSARRLLHSRPTNLPCFDFLCIHPRPCTAANYLSPLILRSRPSYTLSPSPPPPPPPRRPATRRYSPISRRLPFRPKPHFASGFILVADADPAGPNLAPPTHLHPLFLWQLTHADSGHPGAPVDPPRHPVLHSQPL